MGTRQPPTNFRFLFTIVEHLVIAVAKVSPTATAQTNDSRATALGRLLRYDSMYDEVSFACFSGVFRFKALLV